MKQHIIGKYLILTAVVAVVTVLCLSLTGRDGEAQGNDAASDDLLTVEQCIDGNSDASTRRVEKILIEAGIIEERLGNRMVTRQVCGDIVARTPGGSPVERIIATGNLTQEISAIQKSMREATEGDVNGDGAVNGMDARTASNASYAASHTAQKTVRTAINGELGQIDAIERIDAVPAASLQQAAQNQYEDDEGGGDGGDDEEGIFEKLPAKKEVQAKAEGAARGKGAGPKAAEAGGDCAARGALSDGTYLGIFKGNIVFEAPAKKMRWKDSDVTELAMSPSALEAIDDLKQQLEEAEQPSEILGQCIYLAEKMRAEFISSDRGLGITPLSSKVQDTALDVGTRWKWKIVASNEGTHPLALVVEMRSAEGDKHRDVVPLPFDDNITVSATPWQKAGSFVRDNWQFFLAPFLAPIAYYLWRKFRRRPDEHSDEQDEQGYI